MLLIGGAARQLGADDRDDRRQGVGEVVDRIEDDRDGIRRETHEGFEGRQQHVGHDAHDARADDHRLPRPGGVHRRLTCRGVAHLGPGCRSRRGASCPLVFRGVSVRLQFHWSRLFRLRTIVFPILSLGIPRAKRYGESEQLPLSVRMESRATRQKQANRAQGCCAAGTRGHEEGVTSATTGTDMPMCSKFWRPLARICRCAVSNTQKETSEKTATWGFVSERGLIAPRRPKVMLHFGTSLPARPKNYCTSAYLCQHAGRGA